jgi:RNA polymerase sigma-70 factor, ECF subfamily
VDDLREVEAARGGDEAAFRRLVERHRRELEALAYRMLGSLADVDDALQEVLLRAWKYLPSFQARSSFRTWLYRITINACLDHLKGRDPRGVPSERSAAVAFGTPFGPPDERGPWIDPCPDRWWRDLPAGPEARVAAAQSVRVAFIVALQHLSPVQRAVLILRDVVGLSADETAQLLDVSVASVNSSLPRTRALLEALPPGAKSGAADDEALRGLLQRYVAAWESGDPARLAALLREDAILDMPPHAEWLSGRGDIAGFFGFLWQGCTAMRFVPIELSGGAGFAAYDLHAGDPVYRPCALHVVEVDRGAVGRIYAFIGPRLFQRLGLPLELPTRSTSP